jgi:hypothetical protein
VQEIKKEDKYEEEEETTDNAEDSPRKSEQLLCLCAT